MAIDLISDLPVFAISSNLGTIQATQAPVVWAIGYTTDPAISYTAQSDFPPEARGAYYKLVYTDDTSLVAVFHFLETIQSNILSQIVDFLNDFSDASSRAHQLDLRILREASEVSSVLGDLVSTAVAQVYGSMQLTIGTALKPPITHFDESDVLIFMKNIGGAKTKWVTHVRFLVIPETELDLLEPDKSCRDAVCCIPCIDVY